MKISTICSPNQHVGWKGWTYAQALFLMEKLEVVLYTLDPFDLIYFGKMPEWLNGLHYDSEISVLPFFDK